MKTRTARPAGCRASLQLLIVHISTSSATISHDLGMKPGGNSSEHFTDLRLKIRNMRVYFGLH
jgi:hypothetical protein